MSLDQFARFGAALHGAARADLRKELRKSLKDTATQSKGDVNRYLAATLPREIAAKGLNLSQTVSTQFGHELRVRVKVPRRQPGRALSERNARQLDRFGTFRHPVFGDADKARNTWDWTSQRAPHGSGVDWYARAWHAQQGDFRRGLEKAVDRTLDEIARKARGI
ncbi:hypothetical protein GCM10027053_46440 [Intrasporangium mesophilum]